MRTDPTLAAFRKAVKGLTYESESDAPFEAFQWGAAAVGGELTKDRVLTLGAHGGEQSIEELPFDSFFAPLTQVKKWHRSVERENVERFQSLATALRTNLSDPRVFKVGGVEKAIYIVGKTKLGDWAGVKTTAVET